MAVIKAVALNIDPATMGKQVPGMGHNQPPDPLMVEADKHIAAANRFITDVATIDSEEVSDRAGGFLTQVSTALANLDNRRKDENREWAAKQTEKYDGPLGMLAKAKEIINARIKDYLRRKSDAQRAEQERQLKIADDLRQAATLAEAKAIEEATRKGGQPLQAAAEAEALAARAEEATAQAAAPRPKARIQGTYTPRAITLKTYWRAKIVDEKLAFRAYAKHPDVLAAVRNAVVRIATDQAVALKDKALAAPGIEFFTEER
jgi:hypothetical protein